MKTKEHLNIKICQFKPQQNIFSLYMMQLLGHHNSNGKQQRSLTLRSKSAVYGLEMVQRTDWPKTNHAPAAHLRTSHALMLL